MALQRGPLVYAAEWPDNPGGHVRNLLLADDAPLTSEFRSDLLGGVQVINGRSPSLSPTTRAAQVEQHEQAFTAIPYYAWANRGPGEMVVWIPDRPTSARPQPLPTLASRAKVTTSKAGHNPSAVNDQNEPRSSRDGTSGLLPLVAREGQHGVGRRTTSQRRPPSPRSRSTGSTTPAAASAAFPPPGASSTRTATTGSRSRRAGPYGVEKDAYNKVTFKPVTTTAPAARGDAAPAVVVRHPGVEGSVGT